VKYIVLDRLKALTRQGETELQAGQIITLPNEKAVKLLNKGKITPADRVAYKVYSEILKGFLWVVYGAADMKILREQGVTEAIYTGQDIVELKKLSQEDLKDIYKVKQVFTESTVKKVTRKFKD
jgi:hypothetical protein